MSLSCFLSFSLFPSPCLYLCASLSLSLFLFFLVFTLLLLIVVLFLVPVLFLILLRLVLSLSLFLFPFFRIAGHSHFSLSFSVAPCLNLSASPSVCLFARLARCLPACLPACPLVFLSVCFCFGACGCLPKSALHGPCLCLRIKTAGRTSQGGPALWEISALSLPLSVSVLFSPLCF